MAKLKYTLKNDILFKMLFVKYPDLLKRLIAELLGIIWLSLFKAKTEEELEVIEACVTNMNVSSYAVHTNR
ncbi:MAG: hypothetical protein FWG34_01555 [Oscillospiraceae bacterium]|nr:hypothetical protein [Oscillospiraceae bacterium]